MADVIIEKCLSHINNRFKLVVLASQRVHCLNTGAEPVITHTKSKNTTIALNEIASNKLDCHTLFNLVVNRCKKSIEATIDINKKSLGEFSDSIERTDSFDNEELSDQEDNLNNDQDLLCEDDINIEDELNL
ncbi:MAG: hypothetical protein sL5_04710 [Candidatus Mesenet longicola]|uniref:DNA-directed RNA polymerase subunit omega n=1 Tax=Candidatus Mesenet longicola TaxID=1892558 RepID=A0A8J3MNZ6_9RICK|nr:MAG: hypothetical protein sGL2_04830 [Candidatus Mesenet longicola]GHM59478.1 MAG: hypothetical protein sL5_04710 [Candidatus Mesenet longicola]